MKETFEKEIVQRITRNFLDIQILRLIETQPMWGYKIKKHVKTLFNFKLSHSALYPLLHNLEREGFLTSNKQRKKGRTRKVYIITRKGRQYIKAYYNILQEQIETPHIK